jgi:hypothetical protein
MKKSIFLYVTLCNFQVLLAQTDNIVKQLFYGLPLDQPRSEIKKVLASDKRFRSTDTLPTLSWGGWDWMSTYIGFSTNNGRVKTKADSVGIELTFGVGAIVKKMVNTNPIAQPF